MILQDNDPFTQPSFSLGNRAARALWGVVWLLLFRPSPGPRTPGAARCCASSAPGSGPT